MAEKFTPPPGSIGCLGVSFIIFSGLAVGLSYRFVHQLNPFTVFSTGTTGQVVTVAIFSVLAGLVALQLFGLWLQSVAAKRIDPRLKALVACTIFGVLVLVLSYSFTGLLNPIESFHLVKGGQLIVLVGSCIVFGFTILQLLFWLVAIGRIEGSGKGSFWDERCRFCHRPVCEVTVQTGPPIKCSHCGEWVHSSHWAANGGNPMRRCPGCASSHGQDELDDLLKQYRDRF
jgi:hypothetical protein